MRLFIPCSDACPVPRKRLAMTRSGLNEAQVAAFVGSNHAYYRERWQKFADKAGSRLSFNLAAFLGQPIWLIYRKLYGAAFGLLLVYLLHVCIHLYPILNPGQAPLLPEFPRVLLDIPLALAYALVPGFFGNYWYWRKFRKAVRRLESAEAEAPQPLQLLRARGGPNPVGALLLVALFTAPVFWAGYQASRYLATMGEGYIFDATGPLTWAEIEANSVSRMELDMSAERRACLRREVESLARTAGDPETLDPASMEFVPEQGWAHLGAAGRRLILTQAIVTEALFDCL